MKKFVTKLLLISLLLILLGTVAFVVGFAASGWSFEKMSGVVITDQTYTEAEDASIEKIKVSVDTSDIDVIFDESITSVTVDYPIEKTKNGKALTTVNVVESNGTLTVERKSTTVKHIMFWCFYDTKITVRIPADRVVELTAETDTGDVNVTGEGSLKSAKISVDTGDINTESAKLTAESTLSFKADTGDIKLGFINTSSLVADNDTGDISINGKITATRISCETDTGDIRSKNVIIDASQTSFSSDTGDVTVTLAGTQSDYSVSVEYDTGDSNISNQTGGARSLRIETDTGDINVRFEN